MKAALVTPLPEGMLSVIFFNKGDAIPHFQTSVVCVLCSRLLFPYLVSRRSREIFATGCGYPKPAGWFSSSRIAAPPSPPSVGKANPPSAAPYSLPSTGKANPPSAAHPARHRLWLPQARRPPPLMVKPAGCRRLLSSQPIMVQPTGRRRIWQASWPSPFIDQPLTKVILSRVPVCLVPEGSWYPLAAPWIFFGGVQRSRL